MLGIRIRFSSTYWILVSYMLLFSLSIASLGRTSLESYSGFGPIARAPIPFYLLILFAAAVTVFILCYYGKREIPRHVYVLGILVLGLTALLTWNVSLVLTGEPYFHDTYRNVLWASMIGDAGSSQALSTFSTYPVEWPGAWTFGAIFQTVAGLDSHQLAILFPFLFSGIIMLMFLYLARILFSVRYERFLSFALLAGVGGAFWESLFSASALSTLLVLPLFATMAEKSSTKKLMSLLFAVAIVVVHPVMPLMLVLGILSYLVVMVSGRVLGVKQLKSISIRLDLSVASVLLLTTIGYMLLGTTSIGLIFVGTLLRLSSFEAPKLFAVMSPYTPVDIMVPLSRIVFYSIYGLLLTYFVIFMIRKKDSIGAFRLCVLGAGILAGFQLLLPTLFPEGGFGGRAIIIGALVFPITATAIRFWKNWPGRLFASSLFLIMLSFSILAISSSAPRSVYMETFSSLSFAGSHIHSYGSLMDPSYQAANAMPQGAKRIDSLIDYYDTNIMSTGHVDTIVFTRDLINSYDDYGNRADMQSLLSLANSRYNLIVNSPYAYLYVNPSFQG
jgi:hypothetical protein